MDARAVSDTYLPVEWREGVKFLLVLCRILGQWSIFMMSTAL